MSIDESTFCENKIKLFFGQMTKKASNNFRPRQNDAVSFNSITE